MWYVPKFDFTSLVGSLRSEDINLSCKINHLHSIAIVNAYDVDLYQSWTIEMDHFFREEMHAKVILFDIGNQFLHRQRPFLKQTLLECRRYISSNLGLHGNRYMIAYNYRTRLKSIAVVYSRALISTFKSM